MLESIIAFIVTTVGDLGYLGIIVMMFLESTFFPFPSEVVMVPAGYLASQGQMHLGLVLFTGTLGALLGALFNYYLAVHFGRAIILRWGKYVLFTPQHLEKVERYFKAHGAISTLLGRLLPAIRQYISLPAGLARMHVAKFALYTALGALIWNTILVLLGYFIGAHKELLQEYLHDIVLITVGVVVIVGAVYYVWHKKSKSIKVD